MYGKNRLMSALTCVGSGCLTLVFVLVIVLVTRATKQSPRAQFDLHNKTGNDYFSQHAFKRAISEYTEMTKVMPSRYDGYFLRGIAEYRIGDIDRSIADYTKAMELTTTPAVIEDCYYNRGMDHDAKKEHRKSVDDFTVVLQYNPINTGALIYRADSYRMLGKNKECVADLTKSLSLHQPTSGEYLIRGIAYLALEQNAKAEADLARSAKINPTDPQVWGDLAWAQYEQGKVAEAIETGKRAISVAPKSVMFHCNLGLCYTVLNRWDDAKDQYETAIAHASASDFEGGISDLKKASTKYPGASDSIKRAMEMLQSHAK